MSEQKKGKQQTDQFIPPTEVQYISQHQTRAIKLSIPIF